MTAPFTIYVMQSAHTDIGYTHAQEQIGLMYLEHYDRVLDLCRHTVDAPEPQRFKWTCETAWQVRHYLTARPEREEEFLSYARRGQIELTASYLHFTDLIDADAYRRSLQWVVDYCRAHDLPLRCALHCDINGWPWAVADILSGLEIPYFCSQIHIDSATDPLGRRGSVHYHWTREMGDMLRPDAPIRIPQAFWWQGPEGGRVLHWLNEHYLLGNVLGVSSPQPFGADKTRYFTETDHLSADDLYERVRQEVPRYVERLRAEGYPYDVLLLSTGGFYVDNSPPDGRWIEVIARWNEEHADIVLRTATLGEWFDALITRDMGAWPARRVAWPDHWAHGLGSATARVAQARRTQRRRADALALVAAASSAVASEALETALEQERLALEHTFDAWCTTARPAASINAFQQAAKELTFHRAELYLDEAVGAALRAMIPTGADVQPQLYVYGSEPDEARVVHFDAGDQRLDPQAQTLVASTGQRYPFQYDAAELDRFVASLPTRATELNSFGIARCPDAFSAHRDTGHENPTKDHDREAAPPLELRTAGWRLRVDPATGELTSLRAQATGREWVETRHAPAFGQLIHEAVVHPLGRQAVGNAARFIALDVASDALRETFAQGPIVEHTSPLVEGEPRVIHGPVFDAIEIAAAAPRIGRLRIAWRLYHALPLAELAMDWDKVWSDLPEAAYVAFPFAADGGRLRLETGGGFFQPGSHASGGQLPGTCSSYYTIQRAAAITASDGDSVLWLPLDAPLVMPNRIDVNNWETGEWTWNGFLASMPVNHYWHTNFPTSQRGPLRLRYRLISPHGFASVEDAVRAGLPLEALGWR